MKNSKSKFIAGFVAGSLLFGATGVYAGSSGKLIEVFYNVKGITVNKTAQKLSEDNKPFLYNGTTYVPLRFVAEALKLPVKWDASTQTVYIGETEGKTDIYPERDIQHSNAQTAYWSRYEYAYNANEPIEDNLGNTYTSFLRFEFPRNDNGSDSRWVHIQFPLNGQAKKVVGKVGLTGKYRDSGASVTLRILVDDREAYSETFKPGDFPKDLALDVAHAAKVEFRATADQENIELGLFDLHFEK
ncbi:stalk domain-containing protein [Paenibacillus barengoltzii]|jgi:hypothetical protein|uniref:stalk domain-containing protein n=1 Tax=Paenibacillus barengoltzii TaxID=343517 RepID=UPI003F88D3B5